MSSDEEDVLSGSESEEEELALAAAQTEASRPEAGAKRPHIYNSSGLLEKLEDISWSAEAPWEETQTITGTDADQVDDVEDDLTRELSFYNQALEASQLAIRKFEKAGQPWLRPPDYYAEMVKSDDHMSRVKKQLLHEQTQLEAVEERRKQREGKRFQKAVHAERLKEKAQAKKRGIENVARMRRNRARSGYQGDFDVDAALAEEDAFAGHKPRRPGERIRPDQHQVGKKRQAKNQKFGFGGPKRRRKQNDADSAADMDSFRQGQFNDGHGARRRSAGGPARKGHMASGQQRGGKYGGKPQGAGVRGKGKNKGKPNRPGKARRQAMRG